MLSRRRLSYVAPGAGVGVGVEVGVEGKLEDGAGERLRGGEISKWRGWE